MCGLADDSTTAVQCAISVFRELHVQCVDEVVELFEVVWRWYTGQHSYGEVGQQLWSCDTDAVVQHAVVCECDGPSAARFVGVI